MNDLIISPETTTYSDSTGKLYIFKEEDGGRYGTLKDKYHWGGGWLKDCGCEIHHMPSFSAAKWEGFEHDNLPAIVMLKVDHERTASYGGNNEYQDDQWKLISQGRIEEAFTMDVLDIQQKFGHKYDAQIQGARNYLQTIL